MKKNIQKKWLVFIVILVGLLLSSCNGESGPQTYRVGLLSGVDTFNSVFDGFKAEMEALGYVEGQNISYDFQAAGGDTAKMQQIAEQFVADDVDLIVTTTTGAAKAAQSATVNTDIPVVFTIIQDPIGLGLVESLTAPGANLTGVSRPPVAYLGKRIEILKQIAPNVENLLIFYDPNYSTAASSVPVVQEGAAHLGITLIEIQVNSPDEIVSELSKLAGQPQLNVDAIQFMPDTVNSNASQEIMSFATKYNLPVSAHTNGQINLGATFLFADDNQETGQAAASLANKIFNGTVPGELPVETSTLFLTINMKAVNALGLEVPSTVLASADVIIR